MCEPSTFNKTILICKWVFKSDLKMDKLGANQISTGNSFPLSPFSSQGVIY